MILSGVITYVVCQYQNQTLRLRNQFLEQWNVEQMKKEVDAGQTSQKPSTVQSAAEKIYVSRDGKFLNKIYSFPEDYGLDVETIDLVTHQVIARHSENSYFNLLKSIEGMLTNNLRSVFLKTEGNTQYAVIDAFIGNIDAVNTIREMYVVVLDAETEKITVKSFSITPVFAKTMFMSSGYGIVEILDYLPKQNQLLINSNSSNGCGGMGSVELLSGGFQNQAVNEVSMGCVTQTRYLGYLGNLLYFGELDLTDEYLENWEDAKIINIFSLNPLTKERKNLKVDLANYVFNTTWVDVTDRISATELVLFDKTSEEGYALDVNSLELRNLGKLYD